MSRGVWAHFKPPEWVDPEAFLFCGPDPSWTPAKESVNTAPPPPGECPHCKSRGMYAHDADGHLIRDDAGEPIFLRGAIEDGSHAVCPRCRRYGLDRLLDRAPISAMLRPRDESEVIVDDDDGPRKATAPGKLDLSALVLAVAPPAEPGFVTRSVAAGSVSVPEKYAHLLGG